MEDHTTNGVKGKEHSAKREVGGQPIRSQEIERLRGRYSPFALNREQERTPAQAKNCANSADGFRLTLPILRT